MKILVLNSGSSSLKYQLIESDSEEVLAKGIAERIGVVGGGGKIVHETAANGSTERQVDMADHDEAMDYVFELLTDPQLGAVSEISEISAVGHRVVHGGEEFVQPTLVDARTLEAIERLSELAPLHNPPNLKGIRACLRLMPGVPQVAVFDTAFHSTIPPHAYTYALPYRFYSEYGVRRYGFHGTSHRYVTGRALQLLEQRGIASSDSRIVTIHLGNGCSMTAVVGGKAVDTSMGMTPAEGLVMGTRSGDVDPAILLFLERQLEASPDEVDEIINKKSGLLGVSGVSSDMRDVRRAAAEGNERARLARNIFCYRTKKYIGAYAAAMGGLDAVVFTGGIGENDAGVREQVCEGLEFLGISLDHERNSSATSEADVSTADSRVRILVIPTNEERMIARETAGLLAATRAGG